MNFDEKEKQSAGNMVFNIQNVHGNVGQINNLQAIFNDYQSLHNILVEHKVPTQQRHELESIMEELKLASAQKKPGLIQKAKEWTIRNKEFLGATAEIIAKAVDETL